MTLHVPNILDDISAAQLANQLNENAGTKKVLRIDFRNLEFAYPGGALILGITLRELRRRRNANGLEAKFLGLKRAGAVSYLRYLGFLDLVGVKQKGIFPRGGGGETYLPIKKLERAVLEQSGTRIQEGIVSESEALASVICPDDEDVTSKDMLSFCLREIIRNVFEHAETDSCYIMGQRWADHMAEIAIADDGIGIAKSLQTTHQIEEGRSALRLAIQPGISRNNEPVNDDIWQNSGFGLYLISEIGKACGNFSLLSNEHMLKREVDADDEWLEMPFNGTVVTLRASTQNADYFPNLHRSIVLQGEKEAGSIPNARKSASKSSMMSQADLRQS
jgi:hypothetical protein